jgi:hypothetical protein
VECKVVTNVGARKQILMKQGQCFRYLKRNNIAEIVKREQLAKSAQENTTLVYARANNNKNETTLESRQKESPTSPAHFTIKQTLTVKFRQKSCKIQVKILTFSGKTCVIK